MRWKKPLALRVATFVVLLGFAPQAMASWINPGPSDAELEMMVRAAYSAAAAHARSNVNYFARDGEFAPLQAAVAAALSDAGFGSATVPSAPAADLDASRRCVAGPGTELRVAINAFGDGLSLAAVTSDRVFTYRYDPHVDPAIVVMPSQDCLRT